MERELSVTEELVLGRLHDDSEFCFNYEGLQDFGTKENLKPVIKRLKELGYIEFWRGLMNDDGEVAGSGWCRSPKGNDYVEEFSL